MTGTLYVSGFRVGAGGMTCTIAGNAASVAAGLYIPAYSLDDTEEISAPFSDYEPFEVAVKTALDAAGGGPWTVSFSLLTGKYTISRAAVNFALTFGSTAPELAMRAALGFTGNKSGAITYTSDEVAKFALFSAIGAQTAVSDIYEPDGIVEEQVADDGTPYGTALRTGERWADWTQAMEPKASVMLRAAQTGGRFNGWSWQEFFAHHRATHPFVITNLDGDVAYVLRADGASFRPQRVTADYDDQWNIPFRCRDLGRAA